MNTILVPIDFSPTSPLVVAEAVRLARFTHGRIALMHVVQLPPIAYDYGLLLYGSIAYKDTATKAANQHLGKLCSELKKRGISARAIRATGLPVAEILSKAKRLAASYIVIGSHGHTAFYDLLIGSTASGVLKRATCPVLVVPADGKKGTSGSPRRR